ncbi:MAG: PilZ domain-containing protein [Nitrospirota bacterium]
MDKRQTPRAVKRLEVKFHTSAENTAITSDLSETGMFIRTARGVTPGSILNIKLNLPNLSARQQAGQQEIFLTGKVVRSMKSVPGLVGISKSGMGIQLISPSDEYREYVRSIFV